MLNDRRGRGVAAILAALTLLVLAAGSASACPLCMNSDPALSNPGSQTSSSGQWRVTVENKSLSKTNGIVQNGLPRGTDHEFQHEDRLAATIGYQPTMRLGLAATLPFMFRSHTQYSTISPPTRTTANDFGDADVQARYQLWIHHAAGLYKSASIVGGIGAPTGRNNVRIPGTTQRLSEHNQPGTGAWSAVAGTSVQVQTAQRWAYLGAIYKKVWENKNAYEYGHAEMLTLELGQKATSKIAILGSTVYRSTSTEVANNPLASIYQVQTGGDILLVGGGLQITPTQHLSLRGLAYFPVINGFQQPQSEDNSLSFSMTYVH